MNKGDKAVLSFPTREVPSCPMCGSDTLDAAVEEDVFLYGNEKKAVELQAQVRRMTCKSCGFSFTDGTAEDARHNAVCRHFGVMTPAEVSGIRRKYGMTRSEFSALSRLGEASLGRWENGTVIQNGACDELLYLLTFPENVERLRSRDHATPIVRANNAPATDPKNTSNFGRFRCFDVVPKEITQSAEIFELRPTGS